MRVMVFIIAVMCFIPLCSVLGGSIYYYNLDERVNLFYIDGLITVTIDPVSPLDWNAVFSAEPILDVDFQPVSIHPDVFLLSLNNGDSLPVVANRLTTLASIKHVGLVFGDYPDRLFYTDNKIAVKVRDSALDSQVIDSLFESYGVQVLNRARFDKGLMLLGDSNSNAFSLIELANLLYEEKLAEFAKIGFIKHLSLFSAPNDTLYYRQYNLHTGYTDFESAFDYTIHGDSIVISLLDTGLEPHEDLSSAVLHGGYDWFNYRLDYGLQDKCYSGNSYCYHGIAVSGIVSATTGNTTGLAGIARNTKLLMQKIFDSVAIASSTAIFDAIIASVDSGAQIISNSWGNDLCGYGEMGEIGGAIDYAWANGVLVIAATGNCVTGPACNECVRFPASWPRGVLAVGGSDSSNSHWEYSCYDDSYYQVDVVAPAAGIYVLDQMGRGIGLYRDECGAPNYICRVWGTSYAAPHAAGLAALILGRRPDLIGNPDTVRYVIQMSTGNGWNSPPVEDDHEMNYDIGYGRINAARALLSISHGNVNNDTLINIIDWTYLNSYLYRGGPPPQPNWRLGDVNCDATINILDLTFLIAYLYKGGSAPPFCFKF